MDASEIVRRSTAAAIATDAEDCILATNEAVQELLGYSSRQMVGQRLFRLLSPRDVFSNPLAYGNAFFLALLSGGSAMRNFECHVRAAKGEYLHTFTSVVMVLGPLPSTYRIVYILWPVLRRREADEVIARLLKASGRSDLIGLEAELRAGATQSILTDRQLEILGLVAEGKTAEKIASRLCVSTNTVRSHIRHILQRLGTHSRAEAVSVAYQRRLI